MRKIVIEEEMLKSKAFNAIRSVNSIRVLFEFYRRRVMGRQGRKGKEHWVIQNNGDIIFTYQEALKRLGIKQTTFSRCLSELVRLGFIDIAQRSCGLHRQPTKYAISERWKKYGQPDFEMINRDRRFPANQDRTNLQHQ